MSLLLDARKKLLQAQPAPPVAEPGPQEPDTGNQARDAAHKLFAAKSLLPVAGYAPPHRSLLYALGATILLLAAGAGYIWHLNFASNTAPLRPPAAPPLAAKASPAPPAQQAQPAAPLNSAAAPQAPTAPLNVPVPGIAGQGTGTKPLAPASAANAFVEAPHNRAPEESRPALPIQIEQRKIEPVDPLLNDAYHAYRDGKLDKARQMYLALFEKDARNPDVLLGLAAIAQQQGENRAAAQYFGRVLALDPRNAAANAGMTALSADDDYNESRLKTLLREQGKSAILHFALGNLYAGQSRWGEAQQAYFNASMLEPGNAEFAFNLAVSLDHLGQKIPAAEYYRRALQLDPSHSAGFDHAQISQRAQELEH